MPDDRCEVVLYTPAHDATFVDLGPKGVRRVIDLWTDRTEALGERNDVEYVLVFENRGSEVGATISHPHCQIYAYDHVPVRPLTMFASTWQPDPAPDRLVARNPSWTTFVPFAPAYPVSITLAPTMRRANLLDLDDRERDDLAEALVDSFRRLDRLYETPLPTMMWINQQPTSGEFVDAWMSIEIVSPWRARGLARYIAAAEIGGGEFFLPVVPEDVASSLRNLDP
jgi:UDPglucose--hexose-1-phosphate uridylyltransferase